MRSMMHALAAASLVSLGLGGVVPIGEDGTVPVRPRTPSRTKRKPGQPHAGTREIERRLRQEARRAARVGA